MREKLQRYQHIIDVGIFAGSLVASLLLTALASPYISMRDIPWRICAVLVPWVVVLKLVLFHFARVYRVYWPYAGFRDAVKLGVAAGAAFIVMLALELFTPLLAGMPFTVLLLDLLITLGAAAGLRFAERAFREFWPGLRGGKRAIIVGAGEAGQLVGRELRQKPESGVVPVCYLDDDPAKIGQRIHGIPVSGSLEDLPRLIRRYRVTEVVVAITSAPRKGITAII